MLRSVARIALVPLLVLLSACNVGGGNTSSPGIPQNMAVTAGDGQVVITWDFDSSLQYWVFLAEGGAISLNNYFNNQGARVVTPAYTPQVINGLINGQQYAFIMNATRNGGGAGPTTSSTAAIPRAAGAMWMNQTVTTPTSGELPPTVNFEAVAYGPGLFAAVGPNGVIWTGTWRGLGGITWIPATSPTTVNLHAIVWSGAYFLAVGDGGATVYSPDGVTWTVGTSCTTTYTLRGATIFFNNYIAVGDNGTICYSPDIINWGVATSSTTQPLYGVANLGGYYAAAVGANGTLLVTTTVTSWSQAAVPASVATTTLRSIADALYATATLASPTIVAVGDQGTVITSTDALHYTALPAPFTGNNLLSITYGSTSRLMTVGDSATVYYSDDAVNWTAAMLTPPISPSTTNVNSVVFANGLYVLVGDIGTNAVSQ